MEYKEIKRKKLYDLVWSVPMTTLSKQFNMKSTYLKKICVDFNIPTPTSGYWLKLKHGKLVEKNALYGDFELIINLETSNNVQRKSLIKVPSKLLNPHEMVVIAKKDLLNKEGSHWHRAKGMVTTSKGVLNITVTPKLVLRALIFMDTFIKLAMQRGHTISYKVHYGTIISVYGIDSPIYLREKNKRVIEKDNSLWKDTVLVPIGMLAFKRDDYPSKEWHDSKNIKLEDKIPSILKYFEEKAIQEKVDDIKRELRREEQERQQKIEDDIKEVRENEIKKLNQLLEDAERFRKAKRLRTYINAKRENARKNNYPETSLVDWLEWANAKAEWLDPITSKKDPILGDYIDFK